MKPSFLVQASPEADVAATFATLSGILANAVSTLDIDQDSTRQMLVRAVALLEAGQKETRHRPSGLAPWQAQRIIRLVQEGIGRAVSVEEMADAVRLSRSHFSRAFKTTFGIAPQKYVTARRIERAQKLMSDGENSLSQIAIECGFCDQAHFSRMFRQVTGQSPRIWWRLREEPVVRRAGASAA